MSDKPIEKCSNQTLETLRKIKLCLTGRYMSLASVPRESSGKNERPLMAAQAAPAPAGDSRWCHGFCQRENKVITA